MLINIKSQGKTGVDEIAGRQYTNSDHPDQILVPRSDSPEEPLIDDIKDVELLLMLEPTVTVEREGEGRIDEIVQIEG